MSSYVAIIIIIVALRSSCEKVDGLHELSANVSVKWVLLIYKL